MKPTLPKIFVDRTNAALGGNSHSSRSRSMEPAGICSCNLPEDGGGASHPQMRSNSPSSSSYNDRVARNFGMWNTPGAISLTVPAAALDEVDAGSNVDRQQSAPVDLAPRACGDCFISMWSTILSGLEAIKAGPPAILHCLDSSMDFRDGFCAGGCHSDSVDITSGVAMLTY